jgi:hypothetical protein
MYKFKSEGIYYQGDLLNLKRNGDGICILENGSYFKGSFFDGEP